MAGGRAEVSRCTTGVRRRGVAPPMWAHGRAAIKLANQMIVGITIGAVGRSASVLPPKVAPTWANCARAISGSGFASSRILQLHGLRMVGPRLRHGRLGVQLKDMHRYLAPPNQGRRPINDAVLKPCTPLASARPGPAGPQQPVRGAGQPQRNAIILRSLLAPKNVHNHGLSADNGESLGFLAQLVEQRTLNP